MSTETMGQRIKMLRQARGLTQDQLAELVGVTKGAISHWENDAVKDPKLKTFQALVQALRTDSDYLIFGPDRMPSDLPIQRHRNSKQTDRT